MLWEAPTAGGAFDRKTGSIEGNLTKRFLKSQIPLGLPGKGGGGGGWGGFGVDRKL